MASPQWLADGSMTTMRLAYLVARVIDDESWTGGLLVTDQRGLPLDFRYVEPIKPTKLQKLVYGGALKRYLILDAIAGTLLKACNLRSDWLFTENPLLLELNGQSAGRIVAIGDGEKRPLSEVGDWKIEEPGRIALQVSPSGPPVRLEFSSKDDIETERIANELALLAQELDFAEPLRRVMEALVEICENGID